MTGKQLTMDENGVIIVEKPERFDFKLLKTSGWIVAVIQRCISRTSVKRKKGKFLKKRWCCVGGEYYRIIWFYQLS